MSRNRQLTAGKSHDCVPVGFRTEHKTLNHYTPTTTPPLKMRKALWKRYLYVAPRDIKIYCDYKHNKLSLQELARKYYTNKSTVAAALVRTREKLKAWKEQNQDGNCD